MRPNALQALLDADQPRAQRLPGLVLVYLLALLIQLPNTLIAYWAIPSFTAVPAWGLIGLWALGLAVWAAVEGVKYQQLKRSEPLALVRAAMWDGLVLAASSWLAIFALRMGFDFWPLGLLGLFAWILGFLRLVVRL